MTITRQPASEHERVEALRRYAVLDTQPDAAFDRITRLAAQLFHVPMAMISLIDSDRQWIKSCYSTSLTETPREHALCSLTILTDDVLVLHDVAADPRFADHAVVTTPPSTRFYAGAPLRTPDGYNIGTLCLCDSLPRHTFDSGQQRALRDLAAVVIDELELHRALTQTHQVTAALYEQAELYRTLTESMDDIVSLHDLDGTFLYISPSCVQMTGYTAAETIGLGGYSVIHPDDRERVAQEAHQQALQGRTVQIEWRRLCKDDRFKWVETRTSLIKNADGQPEHLLCVTRDISERRQTEERLRLLESVVVHTSEAILITRPDLLDPKGATIVYANDAFTRITGYTLAEVIGRSPALLSGPDTDLAAEQEIDRALAAAEPTQLELLRYRKNGTTFWSHLSLAPIMDADGQNIYWVDVHRDITQHRRERLALAQSEARFRSLVHNSSDMITLLTEQGMILYASPSSVRVLGFEPEAMIGTDAFSYVHPEDLERIQLSFTYALSGGTPRITLSYHCRAADGTWRWLESVGDNLLNDPNIAAIIVTSRDVSERKQQEDALRRQNDYLEALHQTTLGLINRLDLTDVLEAIVTRAAALLETEHGYLYLVDSTADLLEVKLATGVFSTWTGFQLQRGEGLAGKVWQTGKPLVINNYPDWEERAVALPRNLFHSLIGVPLTSNDQIVGVLGMAYTEPDRMFEATQVEILNRFGQLASIALDNARLYTSTQQEITERRRAEQAVQQLAEERRRLLEASQAVFSTLEAAELVPQIERALHEVVQYESFGVYTIDEAAGLLRPSFLVRAEWIAQYLHAWSIRLGAGVLGSVGQTGIAEMVNNAHRDPRSVYPPNIEVQPEHLIAIPLRTANASAGVFVISRRDPPFTDDEFELVQLFVSLISLALENARLFAASQRQAQELALLDEVRTAIAAELDSSRLYRTLVEAVTQTLGYRMVSLYVLHNDAMVLQHHVGYDCRSPQFPAADGVMERIADSGEAVLITNSVLDMSQPLTLDQPTSAVCVPLHDQDHLVAVLTVESGDSATLGDADVRLMNALSKQASLAIGRARLYAAARRSEAKYRSVVDDLKEVIFQTDVEGQWSFLNPAWTEITGYSINESVGTNFVQYVHPDDRQRSIETFEQIIKRTRPYCRLEMRYVTKDGGIRWFEVHAQLTLDSQDRIVGTSGTLYNITQRKFAEILDRDRQQALELIARNEPLPLVLGQIVQMVERQRPDMLCSVLLLKHGRLYNGASPSLPPAYVQAIDGVEIGPDVGSCGSAAFLGKQVIVGDISTDPLWQSYCNIAMSHGLYACWSTPLIANNGDVLGTFALYYRQPCQPTEDDFALIAMAANVTTIALEQRLLTDQLAYQAHHDALTGLPNRVLFQDRLDQALSHARRHEQLVAVLFVDLDRFKQINDTLGHHFGDRLLMQVAERLSNRIRQNDTLARMSGDEFTLILTDLSDPQDAVRVAQKLLDALRAPYSVDGHELFVSASIGISVFPQDGVDSADLQRNADVAMYRAKQKGKNNFQCFAPEMNEAALERLALENHLRRALEREEFRLVFQPQFELATGRLIGVEALLRWHHPEMGIVSPGRFIPVAEESGLILPIGAWVLRAACRQAVAWQAENHPAIRVAVNVSAVQFSQPEFVATVANALAESELDPRQLEIEVTESMVMQDVESVAQRLLELQTLGVAISIDDFGTGYSSLAYLQRLPIDSLKIDQSFVRDIKLPDEPSQHACALAQTIITLAHSLGMNALAEGVETVAQAAFLRKAGCDWAQGYLLSRPIPPHKIAALLAVGRIDDDHPASAALRSV